MPATVTHAYFTNDIYDILPENIKNRLNLKRLKMFGQAYDPFMFYNLFSILPGKKVRNLSEYFHSNKTRAFFINNLNIIKENNLSNDKDTLSFLTGFICHYALDSTLHPYIIYKTGVMDKKYKNTYKYNNQHTFMETFIDNDMIKRREKINPYKFRIDKYCFDTSKFSKQLVFLINRSFLETYNLKNASAIYFKSLKQMKSALFFLRRDVYGIKKNIYKFIDTFTSDKTFRLEAVSYHYPLNDMHNYLNNNHSVWRNPTTYNMESSESFIELYIKAIKIAEELICSSFDFLDGKDVNLNEVFLNLSYLSGLDCELNKELKYFEF